MPGTGISPIFIGGCGRSGTTLLGAILGAHSQCVCVPESPFKTDILRFWDPATADPRCLLEAIIKTRRFRLWGMDEPSVLDALPQFSGTYAEALAWLVARYAQVVGRSPSSRWVDHTPVNVRHAATLAEIFPAAKFIHIVRDGRAVAASILPLDWGPNTIDGVADWWTSSLAYGLATESWCRPGRAIRVRYEDLVLRCGVEVRRICQFLELDYQPEMLNAGGFKVPGYTSSQHALIGAAPQPGRVNAWERSLTARQIEIFESIAGELLRYMGYNLKYGSHARKASRAEKWLFALQDLYSTKLINRMRLRRRRARAT
jgi:hypothetical protein